MDHTPINILLERLLVAHDGTLESVAHPSSKPHRESSRAFQRYVAEISAAAKLLEEEPEKGWIAVSDKLPDDQTLVLIALNDDDVWTGFRDAGIWRYVDAMPIAAERVTHWRSMPAPPARSEA